MARNRMIKPEFWTSKTLMRVSRDARLMFIGLWNFADDYGIHDDSNRRIIGNIFPYDETVSENDIQKWKSELLNEHLLTKIDYLGHQYLFIRSWEEHQKVPHPGKETIPADVIAEFVKQQEEEKSLTEGIHEALMRTSGEPQPQIEIEREIEIESKIESPAVEVPKKKNLKKIENEFDEKSKPFILAKLLFDLIKQNNEKAKVPNLQNWAADIDKMQRIDGHLFDEIELIIRWSQQDSFWLQNILSASKLREKFPDLWIKAKSKIHTAIVKQQEMEAKTAVIST